MPSAHPSLEFATKPPEAPIRAELFGIELLEQHAESLAAAQQIMDDSGQARPLLPRVEDNGRVLRETYRVTAKAIREERAITPAAEWLVDNFHVVDEQLREVRDDLPTGFYRELPKLADGPLAGYPRVYGTDYPPRRGDARAFSRRADGPGDRAAPSGTDTPGCRGRPASRRGGGGRC